MFLQGLFDAHGQHVPVLLAELQLAAGQGVLVAAAGVNEHRQCAGMIFLDLDLGVTGVVPAPLGETERGRVAGVAEQDRSQAAVFSGDRHHGHGVVDRANQGLPGGQQRRHVGLTVVSPVDPESRSALSGVNRRRLQVGQGTADQFDTASDHPVGIFPDQFLLRLFDRVVINQVFTQSRATMVVRESEHDLVTIELEFLLHLLEDPVAHSLGHALEVAGDQHHSVALPVIQGQGFHPQLVQCLGRDSPAAVAGQPDIGPGSQDGLGQTGFPCRFEWG